LRWWDTTGYFPGVPGKQNPSTAQDDFDDANFPVSLHIDLENGMSPSAADFTSLFSDGLQANGNGPPDPDDQVDSTPISPAPPPPPPPAADTCGDWYKFFFDHFEIKGKNFDASKARHRWFWAKATNSRYVKGDSSPPRGTPIEFGTLVYAKADVIFELRL